MAGGFWLPQDLRWRISTRSGSSAIDPRGKWVSPSRARQWTGAQTVTVVAGPTEVEFPERDLACGRLRRCCRAVVGRLDTVDVVIKAAAPLDFRPKTVSPTRKIKKGQKEDRHCRYGSHAGYPARALGKTEERNGSGGLCRRD